MATAKVAITLKQQLLRLVDQWVSKRWKHARLAEEVKKLNPKEERALAEERFLIGS